MAGEVVEIRNQELEIRILELWVERRVLGVENGGRNAPLAE
jgi:hypothetical protein